MKIELSEATFRRLQGLAEPLVDTVEDVILRLLDSYGGNGKADSGPQPPRTQGQVRTNPILRTRHTTKHYTGGPTLPELRGFQRELWELVILKMPFERFSLRDVYARMQPLVERRPHVKEMEAAIRAGLEKLRDKVYVEFIDNRGQYRRLV